MFCLQFQPKSPVTRSHKTVCQQRIGSLYDKVDTCVNMKFIITQRSMSCFIVIKLNHGLSLSLSDISSWVSTSLLDILVVFDD